MASGYHRKLLFVDLSRESVEARDLDNDLARKFIGGAGLAARMLWDMTSADTKPLSEENPLIFMTGPLTGTPVPSSGRWSVAAISPQTGIWGEAHAGGTWGFALAHTPYMGIVLQGKAKRPVYLWINNSEAVLRDASHLWGKDIYETDALVKKETDERASVATIGPAAEKLIRMTVIASDGRAARMAARCGLGAVMGAKNLKAVVVMGTGSPEVVDKDGLRDSVNRNFPRVKVDPDELDRVIDRVYPPHADMRGQIRFGALGKFEGFGRKVADYMKKDHELYFCKGCRVSCLTSAMTSRGERHWHGEFFIPFGSNCLIDDMEALAEAYSICNRQGLDCISAGMAIAFAMELYEHGIITRKDTGGIDLTWGNARGMLELLKQIAAGEGLGEVLGEGIKSAAERIGGMAREYALHVKGLEFALFDPRFRNAMALMYATASRGADHLDGFSVMMRFQPNVPYTWTPPPFLDLPDKETRLASVSPFATEGVGKFVAIAQDFDGLFDCLTMCKKMGYTFSWLGKPAQPFAGIQPEHVAEWLNHVTGWDMDVKELIVAGERIFNLKRTFNARRGISRKDDLLPDRYLTLKRGGEGPAAENLPHLGAMLNEYYAYRGWSEEGIPTQKRLAQLGLEDVATEIPAR